MSLGMLKKIESFWQAVCRDIGLVLGPTPLYQDLYWVLYKKRDSSVSINDRKGYDEQEGWI